jgi:hypothetical protein
MLVLTLRQAFGPNVLIFWLVFLTQRHISCSLSSENVLGSHVRVERLSSSWTEARVISSRDRANPTSILLGTRAERVTYYIPRVSCGLSREEDGYGRTEHQPAEPTAPWNLLPCHIRTERISFFSPNACYRANLIEVAAGASLLFTETAEANGIIIPDTHFISSS